MDFFGFWSFESSKQLTVDQYLLESCWPRSSTDCAQILQANGSQSDGFYFLEISRGYLCIFGRIFISIDIDRYRTMVSHDCLVSLDQSYINIHVKIFKK